MAHTTRQPTLAHIMAWLEQVYDPEIPALSVVDLGIVRDLSWHGEGEAAELTVTITPTYSGCPAIRAIADDIEKTLINKGIRHLRLEQQIAPPWTTDWITERGRARLRESGIAPPAGRAGEGCNGRSGPVACPQCGCADTECISQFGSTPCKALYRCRDCLEPFDYFKCL